MRKTELYLGVAAGLAGIVMAILSLLGVLTYLDGTLASDVQTSAFILIGVNVLGIAGAITVNWHHFVGSIMMTVATIAVMIFGFPWQSIPAVIYIISVVLAMVPVKVAEGRKP